MSSGDETHAEFMARMRGSISATRSVPGVSAQPSRRYGLETEQTRAAKHMAVAGYGVEDVMVRLKFGREQARKIIHGRKWGRK